jgi:hypothetical protein
MTQLTDADDDFHRGETPDQSWTETSWFAAQVPERDLCLWVYPLWRRELAIMSCGIYLWDTTGEEVWELPYFRSWWHMPIPEDIRPTSFSLSNDLSYATIEPMQSYAVNYTDGEDLSFEFTFNGIHPARGVGVEGGHGHLDQFGQIAGEIVLGRERIAIACIEMRDRTWSPRRESRGGAHVCYSYGATSSDCGFQVSNRYRSQTGQYELLGGFVLGPQGERAITSATQTINRDEHGRPVGIEISARTDDGVGLEITGQVISRLSMPATPWFSWASTVLWTLPNGVQAYGEYQDTWGLGHLRKTLRGSGSPNLSQEGDSNG